MVREVDDVCEDWLIGVELVNLAGIDILGIWIGGSLIDGMFLVGKSNIRGGNRGKWGKDCIVVCEICCIFVFVGLVGESLFCACFDCLDRCPAYCQFSD